MGTRRAVALILITIVALGVCLAWCAWIPRTSVIAVKVQTDSVCEYIDERGETALSDVYQVTMPFSARLQRIDLKEGDEVKAGQVVAQIVMEDVENELAEARAAAEQLDAAIAENADHRIEDVVREQAQEFIASMEHTVQAAEERKRAGARRLEFAQKYLERMEALHSRNAETLEELEEAQVNLVERDVDVQQDELVVKSLRSVLAATSLLPTLIDEYVSHKKLTGAVLEKQKAEALARLRQVMTRLERGQMTSPVEGIVLTRHLEDEQFVPAGSVLMELGDLSTLQVEVDVLSQDATGITVGAPVQLYGIRSNHGQADLDVQGVVHRVYPQAFTKISSLGVEQQRVKVIIQLAPDSIEKLRKMGVGVGYRVRARIITRARESVLVVPRAAAFRSNDGGWQVFTVRNGRARLQDVELGLMNDEQVEILSGLEAEDLVIVAPDNTLSDGIRVKAAP